MKYAINKKVNLNFEILEKFVAGVELFGFEVKSIKTKHLNLEGSHISVRGGEGYLIGLKISPYQPKNTPKSYAEERNRKLLLNKKELLKLAQFEDQKGLTIVPLSMYNMGSKIKLEIGVARGKKKFDKREDIKKRDIQREIDREYRGKI